MIDPASTIIQSHCGLPSGLGHFIPIFFSFFVRSSAVASACLVDLHVAIIKLSAIEVLLDKSITFTFSVFASSNIDKIFIDKEDLLICASKFFTLIPNLCRRYFNFFIFDYCPRR